MNRQTGWYIVPDEREQPEGDEQGPYGPDEVCERAGKAEYVRWLHTDGYFYVERPDV